MLTPTLLLAIVLGFDDPNNQPDNDRVLTPAEFVAKAETSIWGQFRTVGFYVSAVTTERMTRIDGTSYMEYRLYPDTGVGPTKLFGGTAHGFYVALTPAIVNDFKRIGVRNLTDHFKNRRVEFTGPLAATPFQYANSPASWSVYMPAYSLDNLHAVKDVPRPKRATIDPHSMYGGNAWPIYPNYQQP